MQSFPGVDCLLTQRFRLIDDGFASKHICTLAARQQAFWHRSTFSILQTIDHHCQCRCQRASACPCASGRESARLESWTILCKAVSESLSLFSLVCVVGTFILLV